jgi:hypothetical protein
VGFFVGFCPCLFLKEGSLFFSLGVGLFLMITQNVVALQKKNHISFRIYWQPLSLCSLLETCVLGWTYVSLLCLVTGILAMMNPVESWLGFCQVLYMAFLFLALGFFIRTWIFLVFHGIEKVFPDLLFFVFICIPIIALEMFFGGFQLFGVPKGLVTPHITGDESP